jgi:isoquinoline 1-oxidoreductase subunit beta
MSKHSMQRRGFLRTLAGGGLVLAFGSRAGASSLLAGPELASAVDFQPDLWVTLLSSGEVKIVAHRSEMGTGIATSLPMIVADEMEADWDRVSIEQAPGDARLGDQNTDGSRSVRQFYEIMRRVGASMRQMLEAAAAQQWDVPVGECRAVLHEVVHTPSGKKLGYGELADLAATLEKPEESALVFKKPEERRYQGKGVPIRDMEGILNGTAQYGADLRLEGMKYAVIARSPVLGGKPSKWDEAAALKLPGVERIVILESVGPKAPGFNPLGGLAVIATSTWAAIQGREALKVEWDLGPNAKANSEEQMAYLRAGANEDGEIARKRGETVKVIAAAPSDRVISAEYEAPYLAHAPMEPPCAIAHVTADGCHCWAPTQNPQAAQGSVAAALKISPSKVRVDVTLLGGGFGRKSKPDYVTEAALLSREVGAPVQVFWTREDDIRHDYFHAVSAMRLDAAVGDDGMPTAWRARSAFTAIGSTFNPTADRGTAGELDLGFKDVPWDVPNIQVETGKSRGVVRVGWLRSVCNVFHAFAAHGFADELAHAAGRDPLEYLIDLIGPARTIDLKADGAQYGNYGEPIDKHPIDTGRMLVVLRKAAEMAEWGKRKLAPNRGLGIAVHRSFLAYVANVVEVEVPPNGRLSIERIDIACDAGTILHEERVRAQMSGGVMFGLGAALHGNITIDGGAVVQSNFHDYPLLRMSEAPKIVNVELIASTAPPSGVGEAGTPPAAPALANAIFAASGHRIRRLPISGQNLSHS